MISDIYTSPRPSLVFSMILPICNDITIYHIKNEEIETTENRKKGGAKGNLIWEYSWIKLQRNNKLSIITTNIMIK